MTAPEQYRAIIRTTDGRQLVGTLLDIESAGEQITATFIKDQAAPRPRRKHRMLTVIEGDTWDDILHELDEAALRAFTTDHDFDITSGGTTSSRIQIATVDPHQKHEAYVKQINDEIERHRAHNPTTQNDGARRSEDSDR